MRLECNTFILDWKDDKEEETIDTEIKGDKDTSV